MRTERFTWKAEEFSLSQCVLCKYVGVNNTCQIYPDGIPEGIMLNHKKCNQFIRIEEQEVENE